MHEGISESPGKKTLFLMRDNPAIAVVNQQSITNEQVAVLGSNSVRRTPLSMEPVEPACLSGASAPIENERVMDCCLVLTNYRRCQASTLRVQHMEHPFC